MNKDIIVAGIKRVREHVFLMPIVLWILLWSGYNTTIGRLMVPGFPHSIIDFAHGLRSLLPLFAALTAILWLYFKKRSLSEHFFLTPLGLFLLYGGAGVVASVFSTNLIEALYWALMFITPIPVLLISLTAENPLTSVRHLIYLGWIIAGALTLALLIFFLVQPGLIQALTVNFLICMQRPFEHLGDIGAGMESLGMALTRPTGFGRYAGIIALVVFWRFLSTDSATHKKLKIVWLILFIVFAGILLFSKGKTEIIAFIAASIAILFLGKKIKFHSIAIVACVIFLSSLVLLLNIPCTNNVDKMVAYFSSLVPRPAVSVLNPAITDPQKPTNTDPLKAQNSTKPNSSSSNLAGPTPDKTVSPAPAPASPTPAPVIPPPPNVVEVASQNIKKFSNLSGRVNGVWPETWNLFLTNPLLGYGFQADRFFLQGQHAHNALLHALVQAGLLGGIPFVIASIASAIMLFLLFANHQINEKEKIFLVEISAILIFLFIRAITESFAFYSADWLFLAPLIAYIQLCWYHYRFPVSKTTNITFAGNKINMISMQDAVDLMSLWIEERLLKVRWIVVTGMHGIVQSYKNSNFKQMLHGADLFVPDGISLILLGKLRGFKIKKRVSGADLMEAFFVEAEKRGYSNFFYGDTQETLEELRKKLLEKFPNLKIAGMYSPPFRQLQEHEEVQIMDMINGAKPDLLWVGLGLPKQEQWIFSHKEKLHVPVVVGVGAAFKFLSGKVKRAPRLVGSFGGEWLWRLIFETKTTWRRVFLDGPVFLWITLKDLVGIKKENHV